MRGSRGGRRQEEEGRKGKVRRAEIEKSRRGSSRRLDEIKRKRNWRETGE